MFQGEDTEALAALQFVSFFCPDYAIPAFSDSKRQVSRLEVTSSL